MTGSNTDDDMTPNAASGTPPTTGPDPIRHDGVGPTERTGDPSSRSYSSPSDADAPTTPPAFGTDDDSTRTFASVQEDDATGVYGAAGSDPSLGDTGSPYDAPSAYDTPSPYGDSAAGRHDARPEDRFITGSTIDDNAPATPAPADDGVPKRGFHIPVLGGWLLGIVRILIGWQFLWAFLDKTFGLGWSTTGEAAWVNGGKPTEGFLTRVVNDPNNPFSSMFETFLGQAWTDWLFMVGLAGIGIVLVLGLGKTLTWFAAICGIALYVLMYLASWPAGHRAGEGVEAAATNPFLDSHLLNAVLLLALAVCNAGAYLGMAKAWRSRRAYKDA